MEDKFKYTKHTHFGKFHGRKELLTLTQTE